MNNYLATVDLHTGAEPMDFSAPDFQRDSISSYLIPSWIGEKLGQLARAGVIVAIAASPSTAIPDFWFFEKRRCDTSTVAVIFEGVIGRRISRAEALRIAQKILEQAERKRIEFAEWEARRGIQWEEES